MPPLRLRTALGLFGKTESALFREIRIIETHAIDIGNQLMATLL